MKITSAEAKKIMDKLFEEKIKLEKDEYNNRTYHAAVGEDEKVLKPNYDFIGTKKKIEEIDRQILRLKHAINIFNVNTEVYSGFTIDQVLVKLPQLQALKLKYDAMRKLPRKERHEIVGSVIDYTYTSYDPEDVDLAYTDVETEIINLQLALDRINNTVTFEF